MTDSSSNTPIGANAFFDAAPCGFLVVAPDWRIREANATFAAWTDRPKDDLVGLHMRDLLDVAGRIFFDTHFAPLVRLQGAFHEVALNIKRPDGSRMATLVNAAEHLSDDGAVEALLLTVFNATDRRRYEDELVSARNELRELNEELEERVRNEVDRRLLAESSLRQAQKMEAVGNLSGGIAHDFNNILQIVSANLGLAAKRSGAEMHTYLENARSGVDRGAKLAQQLLAFGRNKPATTAIVDAVAVMDGMRDMIERTLGQEVAVRFDLPDEQLPVEVDASQMENALLNLAINARDAMADSGRDGVLTMGVSRRVIDAGEATVELTVRDTGTGMDADTVAKVFEPFFTTKPVGKGTGLGLAMVYGFARQSGGSVEIDSTLGEGTTFSIRLPETAKELADRQQQVLAPVAGGSETVLLVETSEDVRATTKGLLEDIGYTVLDAADNETAQNLLRSRHDIDLVIFNITMGRADGRRDVLPSFLSDDFRGALLLTSGHADEFETGLDRTVELLRKPYDQTALASAVRRALGASGLDRQIKPAVQTDATPDQPNNRQSHDILLVEDEVLIRMTTAMQLEDLGHRVIEAGSSEEALEALAAQPIDVLITDLGLPGMSGEDLARSVRATHPDIEIVFMTGAQDVPELDGRPTAELDKPFGDKELTDVLAAIDPGH